MSLSWKEFTLNTQKKKLPGKNPSFPLQSLGKDVDDKEFIEVEFY